MLESFPQQKLDLQFGGGLPPDQGEQVLSKPQSSVQNFKFVKGFVFQFLATCLMYKDQQSSPPVHRFPYICVKIDKGCV